MLAQRKILNCRLLPRQTGPVTATIQFQLHWSGQIQRVRGLPALIRCKTIKVALQQMAYCTGSVNRTVVAPGGDHHITASRLSQQCFAISRPHRIFGPW